MNNNNIVKIDLYGFSLYCVVLRTFYIYYLSSRDNYTGRPIARATLLTGPTRSALLEGHTAELNPPLANAVGAGTKLARLLAVEELALGDVLVVLHDEIGTWCLLQIRRREVARVDGANIFNAASSVKSVLWGQNTVYVSAVVDNKKQRTQSIFS